MLNFDFQPTKDFILSRVNQESIMTFYTRTDVNSKKLFISPFRSDHRVTCSYYKSKSGVLYIHDFATNEHINCFEVVMRLFNVNYYQALDIIAQDFGLVDNSSTHVKREIKLVPEIEHTSSAKIQCQIKDFTNEELEWWESFGVTKKLLKIYHVYSIQHVFLNGELKFSSSNKNPIYGYYFGKDKNGLELWKIYFPNNKEKGIRFINNLPNKKLQGYKQLSNSGDLLIITKSLKDCISLRRFGFNAVAPSSESTFCSEKQIEKFKKRFKHILVMYDQDKAGLRAMAKIRKSYPELNYFYIPKPYKKDFTDTLKEVGIEKMKELVKEFMSKYKFK